MNRMQHRESGIGLVEIMISLTLGLLVTGAIVQIYVSTKRQNDMQTSLTGRQESSRFAAQVIQTDGQMAGYRGCLRDVGTVVNTLNNATDFIYNYGQHVVGYNGIAAAPPAGLPAVINNVVPDTDVLTIRTAVGPGIQLGAAMLTSASDPVTVAGLPDDAFADGDIVLLADCGGAAIFQVTGFDEGTGVISHAVGGGAPGNAVGNLGRRFLAGALLFHVQTTTYYIGVDPLVGVLDQRPALWRQRNDEPAQEIAPGIENMQVLYGKYVNGAPPAVAANFYLPGDQVDPDLADTNDEWSQVVSLRVALLAAGEQGRVGEMVDTRNFTLLGAAPLGKIVPAPDDGRLRRVLTFTVAMRNRLS
jgi:type IV pilus assembly protein PilW